MNKTVRKISFVSLALVLMGMTPPARGEYPRRDAVVESVEKVRDSVVSIQTEATERAPALNPAFPLPSLFPNMGSFFQDLNRVYRVPSLASGVIIDEQGHVLTNEHVISGALNARVALFSGKEYDCQLIGTDDAMDLAVLKITAEPGTKFKPVTIGRSDDLMIGETAIAIGNNLGYEHTVTVGVISGTERSLETDRGGKQYFGLIQTDAAINRGNSGGPLLNVNGEMIGITTVIVSSGEGSEGVGFAIPAARIQQVYREFVLGEISLQRRMDLVLQTAASLVRQYGYPQDVLQELNPQTLVVRYAQKEGLAYLHGIRAADIITKVDDKPVLGYNEWRRILEEHKEPVLKITYRRGTREETVSMDTTTMRADDRILLDDDWFGAKLDGLTNALAQKLGVSLDSGIVVTEVKKDTPADEVNLEPGDLITHIGNTKVNDLARFRRIRHDLKETDWVEMMVLRKGTEYLVRLQRKTL